MCISEQNAGAMSNPLPRDLGQHSEQRAHEKAMSVGLLWGTVTTATVPGKVKSVWELVRPVNGWNCLL